MSATAAGSLVAPTAIIFSFNDQFVLQALQGLTHEELWRSYRPEQLDALGGWSRRADQSGCSPNVGRAR